MILVSSGASYGQRSRGGVNKADLELRESLIPNTPAPAPKPESVHPLTENIYQNPIIISEDSTMPNSLKEDVNMLFSAFQCDTYYMFNMSLDPEKWTIFTWID